MWWSHPIDHAMIASNWLCEHTQMMTCQTRDNTWNISPRVTKCCKDAATFKAAPRSWVTWSLLKMASVTSPMKNNLLRIRLSQMSPFPQSTRRAMLLLGWTTLWCFISIACAKFWSHHARRTQASQIRNSCRDVNQSAMQTLIWIPISYERTHFLWVVLSLLDMAWPLEERWTTTT